MYTGWPKKSKLSYFVHIFAKYWPIFTIFFISRLRKKFATNWDAQHTYYVATLPCKHKYPKTNNIIQSLVVTSSVMGQFLLVFRYFTRLCSDIVGVVYVSSKFLTESTSEKNVKIGQYLAKIWTKYDSLLFGSPSKINLFYHNCAVCT